MIRRNPPAAALPRRSLPIAGVALAMGAPALARPLAPGEWERWWDDMLRAPIHLQAEMVARPAIAFGFRTGAVGEAVVRQVFRGASLLPVGQRFRFHCVPDPGEWFIRRGAPQMPLPTDPPLFAVRQAWLQPGQLAEMFLDVASHGPPDAFSLVTDGFRNIGSISASPRFDPRQRPSGYDMRFFRGDPVPQPPRTRVVPRHPDFPGRDVVLEYAVTQGTVRQVASAAYHAASRRVRVSARGPRAAERGDLLLDGFAQLVTRIWERDRTFSYRPGLQGERYGHAIASGTAQRVGDSVVAGLPCAEWRVLDGATETRTWVTADGVQLRRIEPRMTMEVLRADFRPVPVEHVVVPAGWRRVPEEAVPGDCDMGLC